MPVRAPHLIRSSAASCSARSSSSVVSSRRGRTSPSRSRSTSSAPARRCTSSARSSAPSSNARAGAPRARGRTARRRGAPARARGGNLRARARWPPRERGGGALPDGPPRPPHRDGGRVWRLRLGRRGVRARVRGARALAVRRDAEYSAVAPLVGSIVEADRARSRVCVVRPFVAGELATHWPESRGLLPHGFGREPDRSSCSSYDGARRGGRAAGRPRRDRGRGERDPPDDGSGARRRPGLFETLDGRPFGIRPVLPIAATQPPGESSRLDAFRAPIAVEVLAALGNADGDPELAEALDRWELSLFQNEPFRSEQLRAALAALFGETWPLRCSSCSARRAGGRSCTGS